MKYAAIFNRTVLVLLTMVSIMMYSGILDLSGGNLDGVIFYLLAPFAIMIHFVLALYLDRRKNYSPQDHIACGIIFLIFTFLIVLKGVGLIL